MFNTEPIKGQTKPVLAEPKYQEQFDSASMLITINEILEKDTTFLTNTDEYKYLSFGNPTLPLGVNNFFIPIQSVETKQDINVVAYVLQSHAYYESLYQLNFMDMQSTLKVNSSGNKGAGS